MRLHDFPRPRADNGRGIHWSALVGYPTGTALDFWMAELRAMRIAWVALLDDGSGSSAEVCRRLRQEGMMPIVRLCRSVSNSAHLGQRKADTVAHLVGMGVRYFEMNGEPGSLNRWPGSHPLDRGLEMVVDDFIHDADQVLDLGGLPALPAMPPEQARQALAAIVQGGRRDLFERGAWLAIPMNTLNRPPDYPYDPVHQRGQPLTEAEYTARLAEEVQPESPSFAWDDQPLDRINRWRADGRRPGTTLRDDAGGFLCYLLYHEMAMQELGFAVPIIATAGGPPVGERSDRRYPRLTPQVHAEYLARIYRFMQEKAPPWFFAVCPYLLANAKMGHADPTWEPIAWYSDYHNRRFGLHGALPIVDTLKAMPTRSRVPVRGTGRIVGTLRTAANTPVGDLPLTLQRDGNAVQTSLSDFNGGFCFENLWPGTYALLTDDLVLQDGIALADDETRTLHLQLGEASRARLTGRVVDAHGHLHPEVMVRLLQNGVLLAEQTTDARGVYAFTGLGAGVYALATDTVRIDDLALDGWNTVEVDLVVAVLPPDDAARPHESRIEGHVSGGREGQRLTLYTGHERWTSTLSPTSRFAFAHLPPGTYTLTLDGIGIVADSLALDGTNSITLSLTVPDAAKERPAANAYVLLGLTEPTALRAALLLMQPFLRKHGFIAGFFIAEAMQMETVILVGDGMGAGIERVLQSAGRRVERWPGDAYRLAAFLQHRDGATP